MLSSKGAWGSFLGDQMPARGQRLMGIRTLPLVEQPSFIEDLREQATRQMPLTMIQSHPYNCEMGIIIRPILQMRK